MILLTCRLVQLSETIRGSHLLEGTSPTSTSTRRRSTKAQANGFTLPRLDKTKLSLLTASKPSMEGSHRKARGAILSTTKIVQEPKPRVKNYLTDHRQVDTANREAMIRMRTIQAELSRSTLHSKPPRK